MRLRKTVDKVGKIDEKDWKKLKSVVDDIFRDTQKERKAMTTNLKAFKGDIWEKDKLKDYDSRAQANMVFSTIETLAPLLTDNSPITHLIPKDAYMERVGWMYNNALKYAWDVLDMQTLLYNVVLDALIMKIGIAKVYFDKSKTFGGELRVEAIDPRDFFIAPGYETIWDAPMCGMRSVKPLSWVKKNYPDIKDIKPDTDLTGDEDEIRAFKNGDAKGFQLDTKFIKIYEVWLKDNETYKEVIDGDKKTKELAYPHGKFIVFTDKQFLGVYPSDFNHSLPPYVELKNFNLPHNFLSISEVDQILDLNKELNLQLQYLTNYSRKYHDPNYTIDVNQGINVEDFKAKKDEGGQVFAKETSYGAVGAGIEPIREPPLNPTIFELIGLIPRLIAEVTNITDIAKGEPSKKQRQSASEVAILLESSHSRIRLKVRNIETFIKKLSYLLIRLMQQYYTEPRRIHWQEDNQIYYDVISNTKNRLNDILQPSAETLQKAAELPEDQLKAKLPPEQVQKLEDYKKFLSAFENVEGEDPVYFDFDIEVQTNSTLPMDKQTKANLMMKLAELKMVDRQALLETLQIPNWQEIVARINNKEQQMLAARGVKR